MSFPGIGRSRGTRTIVLTGAGISKSAGIPTFEEFPDLREVFSLDYYQNHYEDFWQTLVALQYRVADKQPTTAHKLLASKEDWMIITMNIDSLHEVAGTKKYLEVHGNLKQVYCAQCNKYHPFEVVRDDFYCPSCQGFLKSTISLYGEDVPAYQDAMKAIQIYDRVIIIGTSFKTGFANEFYEAAKKLEKDILIFNRDADEELTEFLIGLESFI